MARGCAKREGNDRAATSHRKGAPLAIDCRKREGTYQVIIRPPVVPRHPARAHTKSQRALAWPEMPRSMAEICGVSPFALACIGYPFFFESLPDAPSCGLGPEFQLDRRQSGSDPHEREVKPSNDPNQAANRASCGAISGNIGSNHCLFDAGVARSNT